MSQVQILSGAYDFNTVKNWSHSSRSVLVSNGNDHHLCFDDQWNPQQFSFSSAIWKGRITTVESMALKKTKKQSEQSVTSTTSSTSNSSESRRNFYVVYRDEKVVRNLTFDESWFLFTESLGLDNPCSVYRHHEEKLYVDH